MSQNSAFFKPKTLFFSALLPEKKLCEGKNYPFSTFLFSIVLCWYSIVLELAKNVKILVDFLRILSTVEKSLIWRKILSFGSTASSITTVESYNIIQLILFLLVSSLWQHWCSERLGLKGCWERNRNNYPSKQSQRNSCININYANKTPASHVMVFVLLSSSSFFLGGGERWESSKFSKLSYQSNGISFIRISCNKIHIITATF